VEYRTVEDGGVLGIGVSGRLDSTTSPTLEKEVRRQLDAGHARIVFDLATLQYISSAGLRVFIMAAREIRGKGAVALAAPTPNVQQVLDIAGVTAFAKIYSTATEAVQALKP
jgi:anti-anti-sigma factor